MKALYKPKNIDDIPEAWAKFSGKEFDFEFAYKLNNENRYFISNDITFPTSNPIKEEDLYWTKGER